MHRRLILLSLALGALSALADPVPPKGYRKTYVPGTQPPAPEVWLTPERTALLKLATERPRIVRSDVVDPDTTVLRWTNGGREWVTTNRAAAILGKKALNGWQNKLDKAAAEKAEILGEIEAARGKPTLAKKDLDAILEKHDPKKAKVK
jgi:hypothetical protein